jgi:hypothetical protein
MSTCRSDRAAGRAAGVVLLAVCVAASFAASFAAILSACTPRGIDAVTLPPGPGGGAGALRACVPPPPPDHGPGPDLDPDAIPAQTVTWPIEVLGPVGTVREVAVTVSPALLAAQPPTHLWLEVNGLDRPGKGAVQVNDGPFVALDERSAIVLGRARLYGGIGGAFGTLRLKVALAPGQVLPGRNVVRFRFDKGDGVSVGYRVLAFDFVTAAGGRHLGRRAFVEDDPARWTAPADATSPADVAAGERLWRQAPLFASDAPGAARLAARCGDCHAQDGRDLRFFNYSNAAIVAYARLRGLGEREGRQIAAYVRSLPGPAPGRPWNPPFQPGPCADSGPPAAWSAGAGLAWVLDEDHETQAHLPGRGVQRDALMDGPHVRPVNPREIPIALPLLEWNRWLPRVHPLDAYGARFATHAYFTRYEKLRAALAAARGPAREAYLLGSFRDELFAWSAAWSFKDGFGPLAAELGGTEDDAAALRLYGAGLWGAVKQWELMREFDLEGVGRLLHGMNGAERVWPSYRFLSDVPPLRFGVARTLGSGTGLRPADLVSAYLVNAWFAVQTLVHPGARNSLHGGHETVTWAETASWFGDLVRAGAPAEPMRALVLLLQGLAEHDNGLGPEDPWWGWNPSYASPGRLGLGGGAWQAQPEAREILQTAHQVFMELQARFSAASWAAHVAAVAGNTFPGPGYRLGTQAGDERVLPEVLAATIPRLRTLRVDEALLSGIADFGQMAWPANDWEAHKAPLEGGAPAGLAARPGVESVTLSWAALPGASSYNVRRAAAATPAGPWVTIAYFRPETTFVDRGLEPGVTYHYRVAANFGRAHGPDGAVASATPTAGLVGLWRFDETSPVAVTDASGSGNHGELLGAPVRVAARPGRAGRALVVDGPRGFVGVRRDLQRWLGGSATFAAWVRTTTASGLALCGARDYAFGIVDEGRIGLRVKGTTARADRRVDDGAWHHVAFTRDARTGEARIYVDGAPAGQGQTEPGPVRGQAQRTFSIGRVEGGRAGWTGGIDDVRIYGRVLTADEVAGVARER